MSANHRNALVLTVLLVVAFGFPAISAQNQAGDGGLGPAILGASPELLGGNPRPKQNQNASAANGAGQNPPQSVPQASGYQGSQVMSGNRPTDPQAVQLRKFMDQLSMTEDQRDQVRALIQNLRRQLASVRQNTSLAAVDKQQKVKDLRLDTAKQFAALLAPEQKQKLKQIRKQQAAGAGARGSGKPLSAERDNNDPTAELISGDDESDAPAPVPANPKSPANPVKQSN